MGRKPPQPGSRGSEKRKKAKKINRFAKRYVVIVCEGEKTEKNYFNDFRKDKRESKELFQVICGAEALGNDPLNIVKEAKDQQNKIVKEHKCKKEDVLTWCVFDRDEHPNLDEAVDMAKANKIKIAFSNPCFELWYLLHFQDQTAHIERGKVASALRRSHIPEYQKNLKGVYELLRDKHEFAKERAENLRRQQEKDNKIKIDDKTICADITGIKEINPISTVDLMFEELN